MDLNNVEQIKNIIKKINLEEISALRKENPQSSTLRKVVNCSIKILKSTGEEVIKLAPVVAHALRHLVKDTSYLKEEKKQNYSAISRELFENTVGYYENEK